MNLERQQKLFPYFAYNYSREKNPAKYGNLGGYEEWYNLVQQDSQMVDDMTSAATNLNVDGWDDLEKRYTSDENDGEIVEAKCGTKLKRIKELQALKKGGKKCSCGCDLVLAKTEGGKVGHTRTCPCCQGKKK